MGKACLKIDLLVKTSLHRRSMEVRRSQLWAPGTTRSQFSNFTWDILGDPGEVRRVASGARAERKFSSTSKRAPGCRLSPSNFHKFKRMPAPGWAQKMQGHPMDLFLKISVLQANFYWLGDLDKIICPWKLENCGV